MEEGGINGAFDRHIVLVLLKDTRERLVPAPQLVVKRVINMVENRNDAQALAQAKQQAPFDAT